MPNETLINQLETLRDEYGQQQKSIASTQTAFKAFTDAGNKVQKALKEYNASVNIESAQEAFAGQRLKDTVIDPLLPDLRREVKALTALTGALKDAATALRSEPVDVVKLDKALALLRSAGGQNIVELLPELDEELELAQRVLSEAFGEKLRDALSQQGISIAGRAPKFEIGRFELAANFAKRFSVLSYGREVVIPRVPVTIEATIKTYQNVSKAITGRNQDGNAWMARFYEAYQTVRRKHDDSARVNIVEAYVEFVLLNQGRNFFIEPGRRTFKDYSRAGFIYDFYEFAHHQRLLHNGEAVKAHSSTKSQTDNPAKSMWIVEGDSPYDGRYIADIEFVKD